MAKRAAQGAGTIRKKTVVRKGREYTYWEARITTGRDPGTGRQVQRSFTGKTQKEVREKMQAAAVAVNTGSYVTPQKMTVGQWMDTWAADYLGAAKPRHSDHLQEQYQEPYQARPGGGGPFRPPPPHGTDLHQRLGVVPGLCPSGL